MIKSTKIIAVDSKGGRRSRTGSFVSMGVTDREAIDCQDYFLDLADGEEPAGRIKKIELVIYYEDDMVELEKTEALQKQIEELTKQLESATAEIDIEINNSGEPLIEDVIMEQDEAGDFQNEEYHQMEHNPEHLPANQRDLDIYEKDGVERCSKCTSSDFKEVDNKIVCNNCGAYIGVVPMSQRL